MSRWPEIYVLRHGETTWNVARRMQGRLDSPLTDRGRRQAEQMGELLAAEPLAGFGLWTSPQGRARTTAELALSRFGPLREDDRLVEIDMGEWQGLTLYEVRDRWPGPAREKDPFRWYGGVPGGERFEAMRARAESFLSALSGPAVIVTHGMTSRFLRGVAMGLDDEELGRLPGGQGAVFHLAEGRVRTLAGADAVWS